MKWHDYSRIIPRDSHALFSASQYHWLNYDIDKAIEFYKAMQAKERGTRLHAHAAEAIRLRTPFSGKGSFARYVNDAIKFGMDVETRLYYSPLFYGTADSISIDNKDRLRIHDLKTGVTPASIKQLYIYDALYCLDYNRDPKDIQHELRIYQNDDVVINKPDPNEIRIIMDKMELFDKTITDLKDRGEL